MDVLVFSDDPKIVASFRLRKNNELVEEVRKLPWNAFREALSSLRGPALCYLDLSGIEKSKLREYLRLVSRLKHVVYGLVDPGRTVEDVAAAFHQGAVDYLDTPALQKGITSERLKRIRAYVEGIVPQILSTPSDQGPSSCADGYIESGSDWSAVQKGREYTFYHLFIELDGKELMEKKYGLETLSTALTSFRNHIEGFVKPYQGRLWNWFRFGGIVLFPFSRSGSQALTCLFRLVLFKHFYDIESSLFPNFLTFRVAMHLGTLAFDKGNKGDTVSDSLNTVFHLGQQYAEPGNVYVTGEVLNHGVTALRRFFKDEGTFEGRKIFRMRLPVHGQ